MDTIVSQAASNNCFQPIRLEHTNVHCILLLYTKSTIGTITGLRMNNCMEMDYDVSTFANEICIDFIMQSKLYFKVHSLGANTIYTALDRLTESAMIKIK